MSAYTGKHDDDGLSAHNRKVVGEKLKSVKTSDVYPTWLEASIIANRPDTVKPSGGLAWMLAALGALVAATLTCCPALWALARWAGVA